MWLLVPFILVPLIEIALFIQVGGAIGLWPTLAIVLGTAILGSWLVRNQGALAIAQIKGAMNRLSDPTEPLAHGAMIVFAGMLLLTPGFFTDACGFALLIPGIRAAAYRRIASRMRARQMHASVRTERGPQPHRPAGGDVIDGDYIDMDAAPRQGGSTRDGPSGWTRH